MTGLASFHEVLIAVLFCQCAATVITVTVASRTLPLAEWTISKPVARQLYAYGSRSYVGNLFWLANGRLDQALLTFLAPMGDLGVYAVAVSYSGILFGLSGAIATVLFPRVAGSLNLAAGRQEIRRALWLLAATTLPLSILMGMVARWAIPAAFGSAFKESVGPADILLAGGVILGLNYILSNGLRASGRPGAPAVGEVAGLLATVVGLPYAMPRWGITGAAWVSVASYALTAVCLGWLTIKERRPVPHYGAHDEIFGQSPT
jgi:O-antigen/teichoic acid export membrane protein